MYLHRLYEILVVSILAIPTLDTALRALGVNLTVWQWLGIAVSIPIAKIRCDWSGWMCKLENDAYDREIRRRYGREDEDDHFDLHG